MSEPLEINPAESLSEPVDIWTSEVLCLCRLDAKGQPLQVTPGLCRLLGHNFSPDSVTSLEEFIHPEDRRDFRKFVRRVINMNVDIRPHLYRLVTPEGRVILVETRGEAIRDQGNKQGMLLAMVEKNSGNHYALSPEQDSLADFWEASESIMASILDAVLVVNTDGRIVQVNDAAMELLGYSRLELLDKTVGMLFSRDPEEMEASTARFARIMKLGRIREAQTSFVTAEKEKFPVLLNGSVVRSRSNELIGVVLAVRDLRKDKMMIELEQKNKELSRAYDDLKTLDDMKDNLLSLVGHELRSPLANILGYSEFLTGEVTEEENKEFTNIIYHETQRLTRLVNDILDMSRIDSGKMIYHYIPDNLNRAVDVSVQSIINVALEKKIKIEVSLDPGMQPIEFDPDRIQQVIVNILSNALRYTPTGKSIRVRTEYNSAGGRVEISDEGKGIPPAEAYKVFDKFGQIGDIRHHTDGTGLGMPIAKGIIEDGHSGRIWFESEGEGKGTTFYFTLPEVKRL